MCLTKYAMKVRMISALVGPAVNHQPGDIVDTDEGARWIAFGIAEPADVPATGPIIEAAVLPDAKEVASRLRSKAPRTKAK